VEIAPRARVEERRRKGSAPVVEKEREGFTPDPPRYIYKFFTIRSIRPLGRRLRLPLKLSR